MSNENTAASPSHTEKGKQPSPLSSSASAFASTSLAASRLTTRSYMAGIANLRRIEQRNSHWLSAAVEEWDERLRRAAAQNRQCSPNYFAENPSSLVTTSHATQLILGNGNDIFTDILPSIEAAESEVLFVTCFWAASPSLEKLAASLRKLSSRAVRYGKKIRVRIGLSSLSLFQKLFHTPSVKGHIYPPSTWAKKFKLPPPTELAGLDLEIKSIFVLPFSVMHPKFIVIDRKVVWLPSCNVSWESWFEGCVELSGPIVHHFITFWDHFWASSGDRCGIEPEQAVNGQDPPPTAVSYTDPLVIHGPAYVRVPFQLLDAVPAMFLPSPHRANPRFQPFAHQRLVKPPPTPLNIFILTLIEHATSSIYIQTPNLTSAPVLWALLGAIKRGVSIHIITSERLMILEQYVTAGTTTARCVKKLVKRYRALKARHDEESNLVLPGNLRIDYFQPQRSSSADGSRSDIQQDEPVQSHLKLSIFDKEVVVLGSGNMDRASWFTSQELGVSFHSVEMALAIESAVAAQLMPRTKLLFDSRV